MQDFRKNNQYNMFHEREKACYHYHTSQTQKGGLGQYVVRTQFYNDGHVPTHAASTGLYKQLSLPGHFARP